MDTSIVGLDETLPVTLVHDIYPTIDPAQFVSAQTFAGKVVLITGASRGIGLETALQYARAGASLTIVARKQATLDGSKATVLASVPTAKVLTYVADVRDVDAAAAAIKATVDAYGKLDVLVANAARVRKFGTPFASDDPREWWDIQEVNVRGVYNYVHYAIPELLKTKGSIVVVTSAAAQVRLPTVSDYCISKHTIGRFVEFVALEYPDVKIFNVHPGTIPTEMNTEAAIPLAPEDKVELPAAVFVYLTAGKADYLSGRFTSANWDLAEVERDWKEKIVEKNALVSKLAIP
ncbi:NAD-P-binding protein [Artomyces pyxidatus]|uniref:NAD-P-binding protein n=1 Tax=Artomyces pyxidatus TaxID=48021 RepID=A0ACB8T0H7_9AGAM|nr:NAD-P-binding protein [Artomyces pyxidatus]